VTSIRVSAGMSQVDALGWDALSPRRLDTRRAYLRFREHIEPGTPIVLTSDEGSGPRAGLHGVVTTGNTGLFSHPWKMLTAEQFLRLDGEGSPEEVRRSHARRVADVTGRTADSGPLWAALTDVLGEALVVRGFDSSDVLTRPGIPRADAAGSVLAAAQDIVEAGAAGAVVLPFVDPGDGALRIALARAGFRYGIVTGMTRFDVPRVPSYDAWVATLPTRLRRRVRTETTEFREAGFTLSAVRLPDVLARVVSLEASTASRHGGTPDVERLTAARSALHENLGDKVLTFVAERDGRMVACGVDLADEHTCCVLLYGCDYAEEQLATTYQCVCLYAPLRHAADNGLDEVRLGFEAFVPKLIRGATLEPRETWVWVRDAGRLRALGELLDFLAARTRGYLTRLPGRR
jgi:hypothetical protein